MIEVIGSWLTEALAKVVPSLLRKKYTHQKLSELIEVSISSENDGVVVNCSGLPDARVWIEITNLSPITLKLVGTEASLYWTGTVAEFVSLERIELSPHSKSQIFLNTVISDAQANHVSATHKNNSVRLAVKLHFESAIRDVLKQREIRTSNSRLINTRDA